MAPTRARNAMPGAGCLLWSCLAPSPAALAADVDAPRARDGAIAIVVTARRIEEEQQTVPVSVVSVSQQVLQERGVTTAQGLQEAVPGLFVTTPNARLSSFSLRGLGSSAFNEGLESSVALFMDGVYLGRPGMSIGDLVDIERIEVARGPQGTLFGKNATAGTISILTRKPQFSPEALLEASVGDYGTLQYRGTVTGPLSETLAGRLTAYQTSRDGLVTNLHDGDKVNDIFRQGLRGQLLWVPTSTLSARIIAEAGEVDEKCCAFPLLGKPRASVQASDDYVKYTRPSGNPASRVSDADITPHSRVTQQAVSVETNWDFSLRHRLVSISAFRNYDFTPLSDDNTSLRLVSGGTTAGHAQFSQELRVDSRWRRVDSVAGLFLLDQTTRGREDATLGRDISDWVFGGLIRQRVPGANRDNTGAALHLLLPPATLDGMHAITPFRQHTTSLGGFGALNWHLTDRLDVSAGLRYTMEWKETRVDRFRSGGNPSASPLALTNNLTPLGNLIGINLSGVTFNQLLDDTVGGPFQRDLSLREGALSGQAGASFRWTPEVMSYLNLSRGVKSGGINLGVTGASTSPVFRPEIADSAELGLKSLLFNDHLLFNLAAYYARIQDYQALTFDESPTFIPNPRLNNLLNVGQVSLRGVDMDFQAELPARFSLRGGLAWNEAVSDEFPNAPDEDSRRNTRDLGGQPLANAPMWQGNIALRKDWSLGDGLGAYAIADYWFRSGYNATIERSRMTEFDGYGVAGARLGLRQSRDAWDISIWGRNLANAAYVSAVNALYGVGDYGAYAGEPRIIGSTLRLKWR